MYKGVEIYGTGAISDCNLKKAAYTVIGMIDYDYNNIIDDFEMFNKTTDDGSVNMVMVFKDDDEK